MDEVSWEKRLKQMRSEEQSYVEPQRWEQEDLTSI